MDNFFPPRGCADAEMVFIDGIIVLSGSTGNAPGITHTLNGCSVARLNTGSYQITADQYPALKAAHYQVSTYSPMYDVRAIGNYNATAMAASGTVGFFLTSGSISGPVLFDPTGSIHVHVGLAVKKASF